MLLKQFIGLFMAGICTASQRQHHHAMKRSEASTGAAPTATLDSVKVSSQLQVLLGGMTVSALVPSATVTLAISIPASLRHEIMTAVPADVVVKLMNPSYRASVASEFSAGNTPSWYQTLDPELKTFFEGMAKEIKTGSAVYTVTPTPTITGTIDATADVVTSTSSSAMAAAPTSVGKEMAAAIMALAGAAGVALLL